MSPRALNVKQHLCSVFTGFMFSLFSMWPGPEDQRRVNECGNLKNKLWWSNHNHWITGDSVSAFISSSCPALQLSQTIQWRFQLETPPYWMEKHLISLLNAVLFHIIHQMHNNKAWEMTPEKLKWNEMKGVIKKIYVWVYLLCITIF